MEYRTILNSIALDQLVPPVYFPDYKLGIGDTESKESKPVEIQKNMHQPIQKVTVPPVHSVPYELTAIDGQGEKIYPEFFPSGGFYLGRPIEGV